MRVFRSPDLPELDVMTHPALPCQASHRQEPLSLWQPGAQQYDSPQGAWAQDFLDSQLSGSCHITAIHRPLFRCLVPLSAQIPGLQLALPQFGTRPLPFTLTKMAAKCSCAVPSTSAVFMKQKNKADIKNEDQGCFAECWSRCILTKSQSMVCIHDHLLKRSSE